MGSGYEVTKVEWSRRAMDMVMSAVGRIISEAIESIWDDHCTLHGEENCVPNDKIFNNDRKLSAGQEITSVRQMRELIIWQW